MTAARKARAIAWLKDKPKAGKPWTSKFYDYREDGDAPLPRSA